MINNTPWGSLLWLPFFFLLSACQSKDENSEVDKQPAYPSSFTEPDICLEQKPGINWPALATLRCHKLSSYGLFVNFEQPFDVVEPGLAYELNSELFTDYANKYRFLILPQGKVIKYVESEVLDLPVGTVLVKVFALPEIAGNKNSAEDKLIEVRLLSHTESGWLASVYIWHEELKDGFWSLAGKTQEFEMLTPEGMVSSNYKVPSHGQCKTCHNINGDLFPLGPKARNLNLDLSSLDEEKNQLLSWQQQGLLQGLPELAQVPFMPSWQDENYSLQARAKAYLDINCAHCHRKEGSASLSGMSVEYWRENLSYAHGVCNSAHGWRGGGFDIWPGDSLNSAIPQRMSLSAPADRMPPLGRSLVDVEAVELIRQWIDSLPYQECSQ
jgi:uncharacterized repeat protein (TIGR03806 family)